VSHDDSPKPGTPPSPPHPRGCPKAPKRDHGSRPSARLPLPAGVEKSLHQFRSRSMGRCNLRVCSHARDRSPSPSSASSRRPSMHNTRRDLSSPPARALTQYSQSLPTALETPEARTRYQNGPLYVDRHHPVHSSSLIPSTVETATFPHCSPAHSAARIAPTVPFTRVRRPGRGHIALHRHPAPPLLLDFADHLPQLSSRRPATVTLAPSAQTPGAIARPIPVPPPVISATLPESRVTDFPTPRV